MTLIQKCKSCDAPIFWMVHPNTRKPMPIDAVPIPTGNIIINPLAGTYGLLKKGETTGAARYVSHFTTCPAGGFYRGRQKSGIQVTEQ